MSEPVDALLEQLASQATDRALTGFEAQLRVLMDQKSNRASIGGPMFSAAVVLALVLGGVAGGAAAGSAVQGPAGFFFAGDRLAPSTLLEGSR